MPDSSAHHNPFEGVTDLFTELSRMREVGAHGRETAHEDKQRTHASAWVPTTDIFAQGDRLVIRIELAGVDPQDVDLHFANGVLTVSGTRNGDFGTGDLDEPKFYVRERFYGAFRRSITLPEGTQREPDPGRVRRRAGGDRHRRGVRVSPTPPGSSSATVRAPRPPARWTDPRGAPGASQAAVEMQPELDPDEVLLRPTGLISLPDGAAGQPGRLSGTARTDGGAPALAR